MNGTEKQQAGKTIYRIIAFFLMLVLLSCILSACTSSKRDQVTREHDSKKDVIKFYNLEWLTTKAEIDKVMDGLFADQYESGMQNTYHGIDNQMNLYTFWWVNKDREKGLQWNIGGNEVKSFSMSFIGVDGGKALFTSEASDLNPNDYFLSAVHLTFDTPSKEKAKDLEKKLDVLYNREKSDSRQHYYWVEYYDDNRNEVRLYYNDDHTSDWGTHYNPSLTLEYSCGDMKTFEEQKRAEYERKQIKENSNGL